MFLIGLPSSGMLQLISMCDTYAKDHDLLYNGCKSCSLCFNLKYSIFKGV